MDRIVAELTTRRILAIALPVVLSNATVPIQGAVDTAVIGRLGSETLLGAVGLGAQMFTLLFGVFNFLQISASGLGAQALGAGDHGRAIDTLARACLIGLAIAALLMLAQVPLLGAGLAIFEGGAETEAAAATYFRVRVWGAPAELLNYALIGWFAGQEMTRRLFRHQLVLTGANVGLNFLFVLGFGWGIEGVAAATVIANVLALGYGLSLAAARRRALAPRWRPELARLLRPDELRKVMALNRDIFIRTILLVGAFTWMVRQGTQLGPTILAANVVLWQFFQIATYALDGFAIAAETLVGQALGARDRAALRRAAVMTSLCSGMLAAGFAALLLVTAGPLIDLFTTAEAVRATARDYAVWAALTPLLGFAAFQLDGIFVGATGGPQMRNAMILAAAVYLPLSIGLMAGFGNHGIWLAISLFLLLRAGTLMAYYPGLERRAAAQSGMPAPTAAPTES